MLDSRVNAFLPNYPRAVPDEYASQVRDRSEAYFDGTPSQLTEDRDWLLPEDKRVRPACYAVSVSGGSMYRMYPYDTFLGDRAIADCYSRMPAKWKLNAQVWSDAVKRMAGSAGDVMNSNSGGRLTTSKAEVLANFATGWVKRRILPTTKDVRKGPSTNGSWPNYGWYINNSETLQGFWASVPEEDRRRVTRYWGSDPWSVPKQEWCTTALDFFRLLTLLNWLRSRRG